MTSFFFRKTFAIVCFCRLSCFSYVFFYLLFLQIVLLFFVLFFNFQVSNVFEKRKMYVPYWYPMDICIQRKNKNKNIIFVWLLTNMFKIVVDEISKYKLVNETMNQIKCWFMKIYTEKIYLIHISMLRSNLFIING